MSQLTTNHHTKFIISHKSQKKIIRTMILLLEKPNSAATYSQLSIEPRDGGLRQNSISCNPRFDKAVTETFSGISGTKSHAHGGGLLNVNNEIDSFPSS